MLRFTLSIVAILLACSATAYAVEESPKPPVTAPDDFNDVAELEA